MKIHSQPISSSGPSLASADPNISEPDLFSYPISKKGYTTYGSILNSKSSSDKIDREDELFNFITVSSKRKFPGEGEVDDKLKFQERSAKLVCSPPWNEDNLSAKMSECDSKPNGKSKEVSPRDQKQLSEKHSMSLNYPKRQRTFVSFI